MVNRLRLAGPRTSFSIWHEYLLLPTIQFGGPDLAVLISAHADGQVLGGLIRMTGMDMVLGSTNRGGVEAVRQLVQPDAPWRNVAVTPDGPRGPRRVVQPGIVYIASRTGMKVVPIGVGYDRPWRVGSWDRFAVPKPGSRVRRRDGRADRRARRNSGPTSWNRTGCRSRRKWTGSPTSPSAGRPRTSSTSARGDQPVPLRQAG